MLRHRARGLLALTLVLALLQGALILVRAPLPASLSGGAAAVSSSLDSRLQPAIQTLPVVVESGRTTQPGRQPAGPGNDPTILLLALAAIAALVFPRPGSGGVPAWRFPPAPRASRPRGAGRCPTGPPRPA